jgi:hypothetical protein
MDDRPGMGYADRLQKKCPGRTKKPRLGSVASFMPRAHHCRSVDITPGRSVRVTVVSHFTHANVLVSPASRGRMHGTTRWSLMGLWHLGQSGASTEACSEAIIVRPFRISSGTLALHTTGRDALRALGWRMRLRLASAATITPFRFARPDHRRLSGFLFTRALPSQAAPATARC